MADVAGTEPCGGTCAIAGKAVLSSKAAAVIILADVWVVIKCFIVPSLVKLALSYDTFHS